jgi:hypothetical protein
VDDLGITFWQQSAGSLVSNLRQELRSEMGL